MPAPDRTGNISHMTKWRMLPLLALMALLPACGPSADARERVVLVTTTTVEGSGLLEVLVEAYHQSQDRYRLSTSAVGSGAALELGRRGDADVLLTHDPTGEAAFLAAGHGSEQGPVMHNEFVLAGPSADPAHVAGLTDLATAFDRIAETDATFVSRADDSGTHRKELELWRRASREADGERTSSYVESGSGMTETLRIASQRGGYVLTDIGTFRHMAPDLDLQLLVRNQPPEPNRYQYTLPADPARPQGARDFIDWLRGPGQRVLADYGTARFGEPLFTPAGDG